MDGCHYIRTRPVGQLSLSKTDGLCFLSTETVKKKNKIWKIKIIKKKRKTMNPETESEQWQQKNHKSLLWFKSNQQALFHLLAVARFD